MRGLLICPDGAMAERLRTVAESSGRIEFVRNIQDYPSPTDLIRTVRANAVDVVFVGLESLEAAIPLVKQIDTDAPGLPVVAVHRSLDPMVLRETLRLGIRDFLADPFERELVMDTITHLLDLKQKAPIQHVVTNQVFSFLPAKAGVGTSTVALNVGAAMAQLPNQSVLLADFDLNSGMTRFMLNLTNTYSVIDAVEASARMDEHIWSDLVTRRGNLDVLHAGHIKPNYRIEPNQVRELVNFMRRSYSAVCFDLSGNLERYSVELMLESKKVALVVTPEVPSLHVAREKLSFLKELDLLGRTVVVLNRMTRNSVIAPSNVEELLGLPVIYGFANDYLGINRAMTKGTTVASDSHMGRAFADFAAKLLDMNIGAKSDKRKVA